MALLPKAYKYQTKVYLIKCTAINFPRSCKSASLPHRAYTKLRNDISTCSY